MKIKSILGVESNVITLMHNPDELFLRMCYSFIIDIICLVSSTLILVVAMHKEYDTIASLIVYMTLFVIIFGTSLQRVFYYKEYFIEFIDYVQLSSHLFSILLNSTEEERSNILSQLPSTIASYYDQKIQLILMEERKKINEEK